MPNRSTIITVAVLLGVAFLWGYKQEALLAAWENTAPEPAPAGAPEPVAAPAPPVPGQPVVASNPVPVVPNTAPGSPFSPPAGTAARQPNTFGSSLESIRPGQIPQEQITQRNAYFDKLSQQLRDLQGGTPQQPGELPAPPPPPIEAPPPPPGYPGSFPPDGAPPGFPDGNNPYVAPQGDFDQPTVGIEEDDEGDEDLEADDDADLEGEPELAE